jgi:hypothetical protein
VGLQRDSDGVFWWSDGSALNQTIYGIKNPPEQNDGQNIFCIYGGNFNDIRGDTYYYTCICQGVFMNVK